MKNAIRVFILLTLALLWPHYARAAGTLQCAWPPDNGGVSGATVFTVAEGCGGSTPSTKSATGAQILSYIDGNAPGTSGQIFFNSSGSLTTGSASTVKGLLSLSYGDIAGLSTVAHTGAYGDLLGLPSIPAAQANADWTASSGVAQILHKPTLATVATSGAYGDLSGAPFIPSLLGDLSNIQLTIPQDKDVLKYVSSSGKWVNGTIGWAEVTGKPTFATVATSGAYGDVSGTPALAAIATSGSASDLSSGTVPAGRLPNPSASTLGGVESLASSAHNFLTSISTAGVPAKAQPACGDLSDSVASCSTDATNASNISSGTLGAARLPNPSATTLGGVESIASASHNFLTSISTAGVPAKAQPTCADLSDSVASCSTDATNAGNISSGTLGAARLPNPSTTTLGGTESLASVSHKWIDSISTAGVPHASQPDYSDLTGKPTIDTLLPSQTGHSGQFLTTNGTASSWAAGGGGSVNLSGLADVSLGTLNDKDLLKYNLADGKWENGTLGWSEITGKPSFATVATTGAYSDLSGTPSLAAIATSGSASDLSTGTVPAGRLPNPSATTLGGVESITSSAHNFLTSISTSGVPAKAQPACADLSDSTASCSTDTTNASNISSGTLGAARLPNPSATTLGGVESITSTSHNFLTSISTSGVPAKAQPACADLSDSTASCSTDATNASNISSGTLGAARLPNPSATTLGGVESITSTSHNFLTSISTAGVPAKAQPACGDLSNAATSCSTDATNAGNISSGTLASGRLSGAYTSITGLGTITGGLSTDTLAASGAVTDTQSIAATSTDGMVLTDTTAATVGAQKWSPRLRLTGQGWKTAATAGSQTVDWIMENQPVQGTANPSSNLVISDQINAGGYSAALTLPSGGGLNLASGTYQIGGTQIACANLSNGAASCSTDTTNAANISSGTLGAARLPNPSATTLGGVESITSTSHNFLTSISTSGVPAKAQPACGDLSDSVASCSTDATNASNISSGTLGAARLPNPSATTLGGVESITSTSHNFLTSISTSGVPAKAQPACGDLSNGAASCSTDTTNASNISSGTLASARGGAGTVNGILQADGSGNVSAVTIGSGLNLTAGTLTASGGSGSPGGNNTDIQFNNSGSFDGSDKLSWDGTQVTLSDGVTTGVVLAPTSITQTNLSTQAYSMGTGIGPGSAYNGLYLLDPNFQFLLGSASSAPGLSMLQGNGTTNIFTVSGATAGSGLSVNTAAAGSGVTIASTSTGSNEDIKLTPKGTGKLQLVSPTIDTQAIAATSTDGMVLTDTTAATSGNQKWSPRLRLTGQGWKTNSTAASQTVDWIMENQPVQGAANPSTNLVISDQINGGGYNAALTLGSGGDLNLASGNYKIGGTQISCSSLSNGAASCSTDTTNASNISSGTIGAARLPNPSASTLGGVESITSTSHNFLTSISTAGVPAKAQPACADLSDSVASCSTDTTNAGNISSGTLGLARGGTGLSAVPGSNTQVIYNNSSAYGAAANLTVDGSGNANVAAYTTTTPSAPSAGATIFSSQRAGRTMAAAIGPTNRYYEFQPYPINNIRWELPGGFGATTFISSGMSVSSDGTATAKTFATTNLLSSSQSMSMVSAASAGSGTHIFGNSDTSIVWRGNASGLGGFDVRYRFGVHTVQTNMRWFVGLIGINTAIGNVNPSTLTADDMIGFSIDSGQTTIHLIQNTAGAGAVTTADLGSNFPATTANAVYEARFFCKPNDTVIYYSLERLDSAQFIDGSVSSNLPTNTAKLYPQISFNNGSTAAAVTFDFMKITEETDF